MLTRHSAIWIALATLVIGCAFCTGCGPRPPVSYQQLQVQDSEEAEGFDVYMYVAVSPKTTPEEVESLLKWFDEVKFPNVNKMRIFVWDNPQAALIGAMGDLVGSLDLDREKGKLDITVSER